MRDKQRKKVYDWEDSQSWMVKNSLLTQKECHKVIKRLNLIYRKKVKLRFLNGHGNCFARDKSEIVIRNDWGRNYGVLFHEYAHCLSNDSHGGKFVSEYCMLLSHLHPNQPTRKELVKSLNDASIEFIDFENTISAKKLSRRLKAFV